MKVSKHFHQMGAPLANVLPKAIAFRWTHGWASPKHSIRRFSEATRLKIQTGTSILVSKIQSLKIQTEATRLQIQTMPLNSNETCHDQALPQYSHRLLPIMVGGVCPCRSSAAFGTVSGHLESMK